MSQAQSQIIYLLCKSEFLREKRHKKWSQEFKQKFNFLIFVIFLIYWSIELRK